jgi:small GTP-binding protein
LSDRPRLLKGTPILKLVICGPMGVGKTCLVHRYAHETFWKGTKSTIGIDFSLKHVVLDHATMGRDDLASHEVILQLWDFAGESRFREILQIYARGAHGVLLCFDLANPETLRELEAWYAVITEHLDPEVPIILLGLKSDLSQKVSPEAIQQFKTRHGLWEYHAVSSLTGQGVKKAYNHLIRAILAIYWGIRNYRQTSEPS